MAIKTKQSISQTVFSNPTKSTVVAIKEAELVKMLMASKGTSAVTIVTKTEPTMRKTGNPFVGQVVKVSRVNCMIGFHYENSVNNQRAREDKDTDFVAQPRKWGSRIPGTPLVENKGNFYLEVKVEKALGNRYEDTSGNELDDSTVAAIKQFMPASKQADTQQTDKEIILCDYKIANIIAITYKGTCYLVTH